MKTTIRPTYFFIMVIILHRPKLQNLLVRITTNLAYKTFEMGFHYFMFFRLQR